MKQKHRHIHHSTQRSKETLKHADKNETVYQKG